MAWKNIYQRKESCEIIFILNRKQCSQLELFEELGISLKERSNFKQRHLDKLIGDNIIQESKDTHDKRKVLYILNKHQLVLKFLDTVFLKYLILQELFDIENKSINEHIWESLKNKIIGQCAIASSLNRAFELVAQNAVVDGLLSQYNPKKLYIK